MAGAAGKPSRLAFAHEPVLQQPLSLPQPTEPDTIADCSRCIPATIQSTNGAGTDHASIVAHVTEDDVRRYCEGEQISEEGQAQCFKENTGEIGKLLRSKANCIDLTIEPSPGGRFKFYKMGEDSRWTCARLDQSG